MQFVGVVVEVRSVFYNYVVLCFYGELHFVETTVAYQRQLAFDVKSEIVVMSFVDNRCVHVNIAVANVGIFHILEEFFVEMVIEIMAAGRQ